MSYKSLVDFFDRLQFYLQRAYDFYGLTEISNTAGMKLLLLKVMAEALSTVVNYIKEMREKPISRLIVRYDPFLADDSTAKVIKVLARKKDLNSRVLGPRRMDSLTNEKTLLSVSRIAAFPGLDSISETPIREKPIHDTGDKKDANQEIGFEADDGVLTVPQVGANGSYGSSIHVLTVPSQRKRHPGNWLPLRPSVSLEVRTEARFRCRWMCRSKCYRSGSHLRTLPSSIRTRLPELESGLSKARHSDGGKRRRKLLRC